MLKCRSSGASARCILFVISLFVVSAHAAPWEIAVDGQEGLPALTRGGASALTSAFAFRGGGWIWAHERPDFRIYAPLAVTPYEYSLAGRNQALNLRVVSRITTPSKRQLVWTFDLDARGTTADIVGGGMVFRFDLAAFGATWGQPKLLAGNHGWEWGREGGNHVEMRFEPALAAVHIEPGRKAEVRADFYKYGINQGPRRYTATLTVSGDVAIAPTIAERFGLDDPSAWPANILDWRNSPVDLSFLNKPEKPAGKRGFLKVERDRLMFEDGMPVRFWGAVLSSYALQGTSRESVLKQARRLSELGFNLVRLTQHDSPWLVPNIFGGAASPDTLNLDAAMLEKLDWWIKCLKDEGIYVWLDLHVERNLRPGDGIEGYKEIAKGHKEADLRGYNYVNAGIRDAMQRFNEVLVNRVNVYTNARYKDEPAIVAMLVTNENDVTSHRALRLLPDKNVPKHNALYMAQANAFAAKHGLAKDRTWRAWEHGPAKLFLNDLERRFHVEMIAHLRALGVRVPLVPTSTWVDHPLSSLPALTTGNIIDAHAYGGIAALEKNPLYAPNLVHWLAAAQIAGMPLSVSEWNVEPFPAPDRHVLPLYLSASAGWQGWRAMMLYAYAHDSLDSAGTPSNWNAFNDPALLATLPAAALMYRRGDVREAVTTYVFAPDEVRLFGQRVSPHDALALRTAAEVGKLLIALPKTRELPWLARTAIPAGAKVIVDPDQSLLRSDTHAVSDTGQLRRNWDLGTYTIATARTQAAMGWIGGKSIALGDVEIAATTRNATVAVQSLDGKPINGSRRLLISLAARSVPKSIRELPFHSEPVEGWLSIRARKGLRLYKRIASGAEQEVPVARNGGRYVVALDRKLGSYWLELRKQR